jgi:uncharacterized membrane protein YraQ (UPF0718 family)
MAPPKDSRSQSTKFDLLATDFRNPRPASPCCGNRRGSVDFLFWGSLVLFVAGCSMAWLPWSLPVWAQTYGESCRSLVHQAWWAILMGIVLMGLLAQTPKEMISALLGKPGSWQGLFRATAAGLALDLCNHGILMVAMGLYRRGASLGQTVAFLIASPWNSFSLTLLLAALIGWPWMLTFVALSTLIGLLTGFLIEKLTQAGHLPANPHAVALPQHFSYRKAWSDMRAQLRPSPRQVGRLLRTGLRDSRMVLRWIVFGFVLTVAVKAFLPSDLLHQHFGPTLWGLGLTLLTTTVLEVCSEGSSPLAAELLRSARAPGNAFTFLMAGAATDYTEIMSLRSTTGRWICAFALPILSIPQVLIISYLLNHFS